MAQGTFPVGELRPRRWWLAGVLGALVPGLGHLYAGRWKTALAIGLVVPQLAALVFAWYVVGERDLQDMLRAARGVTGLSWALQALDAMRVAKKHGAAYRTTKANHPGSYFAFVGATRGASLLVGRLLVGRLLFLVVEQPDPSMEPAVAEHERMIVVRRGFDPATLRPGDLVAYEAALPDGATRPTIARVAEVQPGALLVVTARAPDEKRGPVPFDRLLGRPTVAVR